MRVRVRVCVRVYVCVCVAAAMRFMVFVCLCVRGSNKWPRQRPAQTRHEICVYASVCVGSKVTFFKNSRARRECVRVCAWLKSHLFQKFKDKARRQILPLKIVVEWNDRRVQDKQRALYQPTPPPPTPRSTPRRGRANGETAIANRDSKHKHHRAIKSI